MKPFIKIIGRIPCRKCYSTSLTVYLKGFVSTEGIVRSAKKETEQCWQCLWGPEIETLSPEKIKKVETKFTNEMKIKDMYIVKATRVIGDEKWNWIVWTGNWEGDIMNEFTRDMSNACKIEKMAGEDIVNESGMHLDRSGDKAKLFIREDCISGMEATLEAYQEYFKPFVRVSEDKIKALQDAFADAE